MWMQTHALSESRGNLRSSSFHDSFEALKWMPCVYFALSIQTGFPLSGLQVKRWITGRWIMSDSPSSGRSMQKVSQSFQRIIDQLVQQHLAEITEISHTHFPQDISREARKYSKASCIIPLHNWCAKVISCWCFKFFWKSRPPSSESSILTSRKWGKRESYSTESANSWKCGWQGEMGEGSNSFVSIQERSCGVFRKTLSCIPY